MRSGYSFVERLGTLAAPVSSQQLRELRASLPPVWRDCAFELEEVPGGHFTLTLVRREDGTGERSAD